MRFDLLPSGLAVPHRPAPPPPSYYDLHRGCPLCGQDVSMTCVGVIALPGIEMRDTINDAWCNCGWEGVPHDLVP